MEIKIGSVVILPDFSNKGNETCGIVVSVDNEGKMAKVRMICASERAEIWDCVSSLSILKPIYRLVNYPY